MRTLSHISPLERKDEPKRLTVTRHPKEALIIGCLGVRLSRGELKVLPRILGSCFPPSCRRTESESESNHRRLTKSLLCSDTMFPSMRSASSSLSPFAKEKVMKGLRGICGFLATRFIFSKAGYSCFTYSSSSAFDSIFKSTLFRVFFALKGAWKLNKNGFCEDEMRCNSFVKVKTRRRKSLPDRKCLKQGELFMGDFRSQL